MNNCLHYRGKFFKDLYLGLLLSLVILLPVQSQSKEDVVKLETAIQTSRENFKKVELLLALGKYHLYKPGEQKADLDSALVYTKDAKRLSEELHYKTGVGKSFLQSAKIYREAGNKKQAWVAGNAALNYFKKNKMPVLTAEAYLELGNQFSYYETEIEHRKNYFELAIAAFNKAGAKEKEANALIDVADIYKAKTKPYKSLELLQQALSIYKSIKYKKLQSIYISLANIYRLTNDDNLAIDYALMAARTAEDLNDNSMQLCMIYNHLGLIYTDIENIDQALVFFNKSLSVAYLHNQNDAINEVSHNIASIYYSKRIYKEAIKVLQNAVTKYPTTNNDILIGINEMFIDVYLTVKDYDNAKKYYERLLYQYNTTTDDHIYRDFMYKSIIFYLRETGNNAGTYKYLEKYRAYAIKRKYLIGISQMELAYFTSDSMSGNFRGATEHLKKYHLYKDSAFTMSKAKQVSALEVKYETEKKDKNIAFLKEHSKLQDAKIHNSTVMQYVFAASLVVAVLFIALLYYAFRLKQRTSLKVELKRQQIDEQNVLLKKLLTEKEWLLKEIHHRVKNNLQIVISLLNTQSSFLENEEALAAIHNSQHRMHAMSLIHQRLYQSENLSSINMSWYINELVTYLKECLGSDKKIKFKLDNEDVELDVAQAVPLGLILNEAISNAIKYAFPDKDTGAIEISLKKIAENTYRLIVADNGVGLPDNTDFISSKSLGMNLMAGLSDQLDGSFSVKNYNGVRVEITFDKNKKLPLDSNIKA